MYYNVLIDGNEKILYTYTYSTVQYLLIPSVQSIIARNYKSFVAIYEGMYGNNVRWLYDCCVYTRAFMIDQLARYFRTLAS